MSRTVLVVRDEVIGRNALLTLLSSEDIEVLEADSANEAIPLSRKWENGIDLLVMDCFVKTVPAGDLWATLQQSSPEVKLLRICGDQSVRGERGLDPSGDSLIRPFSDEDLVATVKKILGSGAGRNQAGR